MYDYMEREYEEDFDYEEEKEDEAISMLRFLKSIKYYDKDGKMSKTSDKEAKEKVKTIVAKKIREGEDSIVDFTKEFDSYAEFLEKVKAEKGKGQALDPVIRKEAEEFFEVDLSDVKVHTYNRADFLARSINAKAFAYGTDIFFAQNEYNPLTFEGQRLIWHELRHVVHQKAKNEELIQRAEVAEGIEEKGQSLSDKVKEEAKDSQRGKPGQSNKKSSTSPARERNLQYRKEKGPVVHLLTIDKGKFTSKVLYIVEKGDTLSSISIKFGRESIGKLRRLNKRVIYLDDFEEKSLIHPGTVLVIRENDVNPFTKKQPNDDPISQKLQKKFLELKKKIAGGYSGREKLIEKLSGGKITGKVLNQMKIELEKKGKKLGFNYTKSKGYLSYGFGGDVGIGLIPWGDVHYNKDGDFIVDDLFSIGFSYGFTVGEFTRLTKEKWGSKEETGHFFAYEYVTAERDKVTGANADIDALVVGFHFAKNSWEDLFKGGYTVDGQTVSLGGGVDLEFVVSDNNVGIGATISFSTGYGFSSYKRRGYGYAYLLDE